MVANSMFFKRIFLLKSIKIIIYFQVQVSNQKHIRMYITIFHILLIVKFGKIKLWVNVTLVTIQNCIVSKKKLRCQQWVYIPLHSRPSNLLLLFCACPFDVLLSFVSMTPMKMVISTYVQNHKTSCIHQKLFKINERIIFHNLHFNDM